MVVLIRAGAGRHAILLPLDELGAAHGDALLILASEGEGARGGQQGHDDQRRHRRQEHTLLRGCHLLGVSCFVRDGNGRVNIHTYIHT